MSSKSETMAERKAILRALAELEKIAPTNFPGWVREFVRQMQLLGLWDDAPRMHKVEEIVRELEAKRRAGPMTGADALACIAENAPEQKQ